MNQQTSQAATSAAGIGQNLAEWEPHLTNSGQLIRNSNQQLQQLQLTVAEDPHRRCPHWPKTSPDQELDYQV
jgi:hypothetical protein